jgi:hypothetical protein
MTALITAAANASPFEMSCGFSSEYAPKSGSTIDTAGSVPAAASAKNRGVVRRCRTAPTSPSGYRSAVYDLLPRTVLASEGISRPIAAASFRKSTSPPPPSSRFSTTLTRCTLW